MWNASFTTAELEFFVSIETVVTIVPNFTDDQLFLICGKVGPFKANQEISVPLWLAIHLKENNKCIIVQPMWFKRQILDSFHQNEKNNKELMNLQSRQFFEISYIFLSKASQSITEISHVRSQIEGIENIRREKIRKLFEQNRGCIRLKNLTTYEANRLRQPLSKLAVMVDRLKKTEFQRNKKQ